MKSVDIFFPLYVGDYQKATQMLSCEEHGAYLLLIMALWQKDGRIPLNMKKLSRVCRLSEQEFIDVWVEIKCYFFADDENNVGNNRVDEELEKAKARQARSQKNGSKGGRPPKPVNNPAGNPTGNPEPNLKESSSHTHSHSPSESKSKTLRERISVFTETAHTLIPNDFPKGEIEKFIAYWTEHAPNDRKFKAEKQDSFNIETRLTKWHGLCKPPTQPHRTPAIASTWPDRNDLVNLARRYEYDEGMITRLLEMAKTVEWRWKNKIVMINEIAKELKH